MCSRLLKEKKSSKHCELIKKIVLGKIDVFQITEPDFYAPRDILISFEKDFMEKMSYKSYIEIVATMIVRDRGAYVTPDAISRDALDVVNFEIELAKVGY